VPRRADAAMYARTRPRMYSARHAHGHGGEDLAASRPWVGSHATRTVFGCVRKFSRVSRLRTYMNVASKLLSFTHTACFACLCGSRYAGAVSSEVNGASVCLHFDGIDSRIVFRGKVVVACVEDTFVLDWGASDAPDQFYSSERQRLC
jgi:hypothetical protein